MLFPRIFKFVIQIFNWWKIVCLSFLLFIRPVGIEIFKCNLKCNFYPLFDYLGILGGFKQSTFSSMNASILWFEVQSGRIICVIYETHITHFYYLVCTSNLQNWHHLVTKLGSSIVDLTPPNLHTTVHLIGKNSQHFSCQTVTFLTGRFLPLKDELLKRLKREAN